MLEKPPIIESLIISSLEDGYGLPVTYLEFLPIGYDATAWVYRVETSNRQNLFLKLKKGTPKPAMLLAPNHLKTVGGLSIPAPIVSRAGRLTVEVNQDYSLILYPFIDGKNGGRDGMTLEHWENFGRQLRTIHHVPLSQTVIDALPLETFVSHKLEMFLNNLRRAKAGRPRDDYEAQLIHLWEHHDTDIQHCYERMQTLGRALQTASLPKLMCHADCHPYNLMVSEDGQVMLIDWDEVIYAPKERDLMFIGAWAGDINSPQAQAFYRGYGQTDIDQSAIAYYRYEWAIQEMAEYSDVIFFRTDFGAETKQDSLDGFAALFTPNHVVALAYHDDVQ